MRSIYFAIFLLLLSGCTARNADRMHVSLIGSWECKGRVSGAYSPFYSGSPDLSLWQTNIEQDAILLVFTEKVCKVYVNNELMQETLYDLEYNADGTYWLDLTKFLILPGESEPLLHGYGSLPLSWRGDSFIRLVHNGMGTLEFEMVK